MIRVYVNAIFFATIWLLCLASMWLLSVENVYADGGGFGNCVEGALPGCDGVCGSGATIDECGICGGENNDMDECGICFGEGGGACGCGIEADECGICGGNGPGVCGCDLSIVPDSCGVCGGEGPGECGCDPENQPDKCGVCGGDGSSCGNTCEHYLVHNRPDYDAYYTGENAGKPIFSGRGALLKCLNKAKIACGSDGSRDRYDFSDDCIAGYLYSSGKVATTEVTSCLLLGCDWGKGIGASYWVMDRSCNRVEAQPDQFCHLYMDWIVSPISLLWDTEASIEAFGVPVQFPLNREKSDLPWYIWRASAKTPLLVWDPEHRGQITSAEQLFGSWTFGGKRHGLQRTSLHQRPTVQDEPWSDGFEALGTLDQDGSGVIEGNELKPLGLWFDHNENGVSDEGEVVSAQKAGLTELRYQGTLRDSITGDVSLEHGYSRIESGSLVRGTSVDWFAKGYQKHAEAVQQLMHRNNLPVLLKNRSDSRPDSVKHEEAPVALEESRGWRQDDPLFGTWEWSIDERPSWASDEAVEESTGLIFFTDSVNSEKNQFLGRSYIEVPFVGASKQILNSTIVALEFKGWKVVDDKNRYVYRYSLFDSHGNETKTSLYIDESEKHAIGSSTFISARTGNTFEYKFSAQKVLERAPQYQSVLQKRQNLH